MKIDIQVPRPAVLALLGVIAIYALGGYAVTVALGEQANFSFVLYDEVVFLVSALALPSYIIWRCVAIMVFERPHRLTRTIIADLRSRIFSWRKFNAVWPLYFGFIVLMSAFSSMKSMIPVLEPYRFDAMFMHWDRVLHFGVDPWRWLQPVMGHEVVTQWTNYIYNAWFVVIFTVLFWQLFDLRRPELRLRYFWTNFMIWIVVGTVMATLLSSAGPCFYDHVVHGVNPYAEQMKYLRAADKHVGVWAVGTQDLLWGNYARHRLGIGTGISAMPSVHVAMATLCLLLGWRYGWRMRAFFAAFWIAIMAGSVHLAWHYAIDGYAGAIIVVVMWWIFGRVLGADDKKIYRSE